MEQYLQKYQVWCVAGDEDLYLGSSIGDGFKDSCIRKARRDKQFRSKFDEKTMTFSGMKLKAGENGLY